MKRLVYYTSGLSPCGVASYQRHLAKALESHFLVETVRFPVERILGDDLSKLFRQRRKYRQLAKQSASFDHVLIDYTDTFWNGSRPGENFFPAFANALRRPATVLLHEGPGRTDPPDLTGYWPVKLLKRLTHLGLAAWDGRTGNYSKFVERDLFRFAKHVVTHAESLTGIAPGKVKLIPAPVYPLDEPTLTSDEVDRRFGLQNRKVVLLLGFPQPSKGFDRAIRALVSLPGEFVVVQAGANERSRPEAEKLLALARELGVADRFIPTGFLSEGELSAVIRRADVGLAPFRSIRHSSGLGHLIGGGLPIVASEIPGTAELAADGAGILFADCENGLAGGIQTALADSGLRAKNESYARRRNFAAVAAELARIME